MKHRKWGWAVVNWGQEVSSFYGCFCLGFMSVAVKNASPSGQRGEVGLEKTTQTVLYRWESTNQELRYLFQDALLRRRLEKLNRSWRRCGTTRPFIFVCDRQKLWCKWYHVENNDVRGRVNKDLRRQESVHNAKGPISDLRVQVVHFTP